MHVHMIETRTLQDAGRERTLTTGEVYDLPDLVAQSLLDQRIAERPKRRRLRAPERKPAMPAETKAAV